MEVFDNQSEEHPLSSSWALAQQNCWAYMKCKSHSQLCYRIHQQHIVNAFGNNTVFIEFRIKSSQNHRKSLLNCIEYVVVVPLVTSLRVFQNGRFFGDFARENCKFLSFKIRTAIFNTTTSIYSVNEVI